MPSDEFWFGKPSRFQSYIAAYKLRLEREEEIKASLIDYQAWLTGLYVHNAVGVVLGNAFSKGRKAKYVEEPISFKQRRQKSIEAEEERVKELEKQFLAFKRLTDTMNNGLRRR